jgi:hypothetical protein
MFVRVLCAMLKYAEFKHREVWPYRVYNLRPVQSAGALGFALLSVKAWSMTF